VLLDQEILTLSGHRHSLLYSIAKVLQDLFDNFNIYAYVAVPLAFFSRQAEDLAL